jgi:hypothetical protein
VLEEKEISKHLQQELQYQHLYNLRDILEDIANSTVARRMDME